MLEAAHKEDQCMSYKILNTRQVNMLLAPAVMEKLRSERLYHDGRIIYDAGSK